MSGDAELDAAMLRNVLVEVRSLLNDLATPCRVDLAVADLVADLGDRIGYGALMTTAAGLWRQRLAEQGFLVGGEFSPNICQMTAQRALLKVALALEMTRPAT